MLDEQGGDQVSESIRETSAGIRTSRDAGRNQFDPGSPRRRACNAARFPCLDRKRPNAVGCRVSRLQFKGEWRTLESIGKNCLVDPIVNGIIVNTRDITDRKASRSVSSTRLSRCAHRLAKPAALRTGSHIAIAHAGRDGTRCVVMFIDIDNFKNINDSMGHDVGDELLPKSPNVCPARCARRTRSRGQGAMSSLCCLTKWKVIRVPRASRKNSRRTTRGIQCRRS